MPIRYLLIFLATPIFLCAKDAARFEILAFQHNSGIDFTITLISQEGVLLLEPNEDAYQYSIESNDGKTIGGGVFRSLQGPGPKFLLLKAGSGMERPNTRAHGFLPRVIRQDDSVFKIKIIYILISDLKYVSTADDLENIKRVDFYDMEFRSKNSLPQAIDPFCEKIKIEQAKGSRNKPKKRGN